MSAIASLARAARAARNELTVRIVGSSSNLRLSSARDGAGTRTLCTMPVVMLRSFLINLPGCTVAPQNLATGLWSGHE